MRFFNIVEIFDVFGSFEREISNLLASSEIPRSDLSDFTIFYIDYIEKTFFFHKNTLSGEKINHDFFAFLFQLL